MYLVPVSVISAIMSMFGQLNGLIDIIPLYVPAIRYPQQN
jgi:hypothetical protein